MMIDDEDGDDDVNKGHSGSFEIFLIPDATVFQPGHSPVQVSAVSLNASHVCACCFWVGG